MKHQSLKVTQLPSAVEKYLTKHGSDSWSLILAADKKYNNIVVIPAIAEYENIKKLFSSLSQTDGKYFNETLFIFVVNNLKSSDVQVKEENKHTLNFLREKINGNSELNIGLVDASSERNELPEKDGGVGLARKIGMDLALSVFDYNSRKMKMLICLDADCTVANNYLTSIVDSVNSKNISAACVQYEHKLPEEHQHKLAIICYEIFLRYYLLGLQYAGSPFGFPTIGSTMVCDYESYIKVGGMNKKKAAEDFYFMEKLGKITTVERIDSTKVYPSSRPSWRVPFGTGQRVTRFLKEAQDEYVLYNPETFLILKQWIEVFHSEEIYETGKYLRAAKQIDNSLHEFLVRNSFEEDWNKILGSSKSQEQIMKQKLIWFDGFRTLKLTHFLRDNGYPLINMFDALDKLFEMTGDNHRFERTESIPSAEIQLEYLNHIRDLT